MTCSTFLTYTISANENIEEPIVEEIIEAEEEIVPETHAMDFPDAYYGSGNPLASFRPSCTWYVWGRVKQITEISLPKIIENWYNASYLGAGQYSNMPSTHAIVMIYTGTVFMHTAFVESWDGQTIHISESNNYIGQKPEGYYEFIGTLDEYIDTRIRRIGYTEVRFIPLEAPESRLYNVQYSVEPYSQATHGGRLNVKWDATINSVNDYFEVRIDYGEGNFDNRIIENKQRSASIPIPDTSDLSFSLILHSAPDAVAGPYAFTVDYGFKQMENGLQYKNWDTTYYADRWAYIDDFWYYFNQSGYALDGWQIVNGKKYYFENYKMATGWIEIEGKWYYFIEEKGSNEGLLCTEGWKKIDDIWYYFNEDGSVKNGFFFDKDGDLFYFDDQGMLLVGWQEIDGTWYYFDVNTGAANGWQLINDRWYYFNEYEMVTGWQTINNKIYYFDKDGAMAKGLVELDGKFYFFNDDRKTGLQNINDKYYYFNADGTAFEEGWKEDAGNKYYFENYTAIIDRKKKIAGTWYYFNKSGMMAKSNWAGNDEAGWVYADVDGALVKGWQYINNTWYYFDENGTMLTGLQTIDNQLYYFNQNGAMMTGLQNVNGTYYYFNIDGTAYKNGWVLINNTWYYFEDYKAITGEKYINGHWYYFDRSSRMLKNQWIQDEKGWHYVDGEGYLLEGWQVIGSWYFFENRTMATGWCHDGKNLYYFDDNGHYQMGKWAVYDNTWGYLAGNGCAVNGWQKISNKWYYFDNYKMATGFTVCGNDAYYLLYDGNYYTSKWVEYDGTWVYLDGSGKAVNGWNVINGTKYYFDNWKMANGWQEIDNQWYYFEQSGKQVTGWRDIDGKRYYFNEEAKKGFQTIDGKLYYFNEDTCALRKQDFTINGTNYYINSSDYSIKTGWVQINNQWRYLNPETLEYIQSGWQTIDGKKYYFENYQIIKGWKKMDNLWYYFELDKGHLLTGWQKISNKWYYLDEYALTGFQKIDGKWYYFDKDACSMVSTTFFINEIPYLTNNDGSIRTGWSQYGINWRYLDSDTCQYRKDEWSTINGKTYYFKSDASMLTGWIRYGDSWRYCDLTSGALVTNNWVKDDYNWWYYQDENGLSIKGWRKIGGYWYYFSYSDEWDYREGIYKQVFKEFAVSIDWKYIDGEWYCFDDSGHMLTGWIKTKKGDYYYTNGSGVMLHDMWVSASGYSYYLDSSGKMARSQWIDGKYYVGSDGRWLPGM